MRWKGFYALITIENIFYTHSKIEIVYITSDVLIIALHWIYIAYLYVSNKYMIEYY